MTLTLPILALTGLAPLLGGPSPQDKPKAAPPQAEAVETEEAKTIWQYLSARYDKNDDGKISPSEYTRGSTQFERLDKDKNGFIEEADSKQQGRRERGAGGRGSGDGPGGRNGGRNGRGRGTGDQPAAAPTEGSLAPDFALETLYLSEREQAKAAEGAEAKYDSIKLSSLKGKRPVALIFGSYTWPPFRRSVDRLKELHSTYGKEIEFLVVYITEAHALDGASPMGGNGSPIVEEPTTLEERRKIAHRCDIALGLAPMTVLIDDMKNTAGGAYSGHPDRLYLVDENGRISYAGDRGPRGFSPDELEDAIRVELEMPALEREEPAQERRRGR